MYAYVCLCVCVYVYASVYEYAMCPPTITSVMPRYGDKYLSTDGNESVIITGTEFGPNISSNENFIYGECIPRLSNQEITKKSACPNLRPLL